MMLKPSLQSVIAVLLGTAVLSGIPALSQSVQAQTGGTTQERSPSGQWLDFKSAQGGFAVSMPGPPTERVQTTNTQAGDINTYFFGTSQENGTVKYLVSYVDLPKGVEVMPANLLLEMITGEVTKEASNKVLDERVIKLENYSGREIKVESRDKTIMVQRSYVVNQRVYQVAVEVASGKETQSAKDIERFLNSFKLI